MSKTEVPICDYCDRPAELASGAEVYPHRKELRSRQFWRCTNCDAWVGCHLPAAAGGVGDGTVPLGNLANAELRQWRTTVKTFLDAMWKSKAMSRTEAYAWLAAKLAIPAHDCQVARMPLEQCRAAMAALAERDDPLQ